MPARRTQIGGGHRPIRREISDGRDFDDARLRA
jgi:hypothetical protein